MINPGTTLAKCYDFFDKGHQNTAISAVESQNYKNAFSDLLKYLEDRFVALNHQGGLALKKGTVGSYETTFFSGVYILAHIQFLLENEILSEAMVGWGTAFLDDYQSRCEILLEDVGIKTYNALYVIANPPE